MDHPFFGNWLPKNKKPTMSKGARDFCMGKPLNPVDPNKEGLIEDFQDKAKALKEMDNQLSPEDRKLMAQALGVGNSSTNNVALRFREAMNNMNKKNER